jgi:hypothetical protein
VVKGTQHSLCIVLPQAQAESRVSPPAVDLMMQVPVPAPQRMQTEKPLSIQEILKKLNQIDRDISEADLPTLESISDELKKYQERIEHINAQSPNN